MELRMEIDSIPSIFFSSIHPLVDFFSKLSSLCSHPLVSTIVTLYTLLLIYVPSFFIRIAFSPVINSVGIILFFLLKSGTKERLEKESRFLDLGGNERLEKESTLESRVIRKDNCSKWTPTNDNRALYSGLVLESSSIESLYLDFVDQNQTHVEIVPKAHLGLESNQTHVKSKPKSVLDVECNPFRLEFKHDLGLEFNSQDDYHKRQLLETNSMESPQVVERDPKMEMDAKQVDAKMTFLAWNMRTPLEIIYEAYEGEEEDDDDDDEKSVEEDLSNDKHYPSLPMYYPKSDTDSLSDDDFPMQESWGMHEGVFFKWEEEDGDELIEISLDHYGKRTTEFCHAEEENLIEIDIFPMKD